MDDGITRHAVGAAITVWVVPGSSRTDIVGVHGDAIRIRVAAAPEGGKANRALARLLAEATGATKVELVRGGSSRRKHLILHGVEPDAVRVSLGLAPPEVQRD